MEIATHNNITIVLEHYIDFSGRYFERELISINGNILTQDTYDNAYSNWRTSGRDVMPQAENFDINFVRSDGKSASLRLFSHYTYIYIYICVVNLAVGVRVNLLHY